MTQSDLEGTRHRLLGVLWKRLAELEADETRTVIWGKTDWDLAAGDVCLRCHKPSLRLRDGVCFPCVADVKERAYQMAGRLSLLTKRYPKLTRGLRRKMARGRGLS